MSEVTPELQAKFTNELLNEFAAALDKALRENLSRISPKVPSQTIRAIRFSIMEASASDISAQLTLTFQDSGRISEMKVIERSKMVPIEVIKDWVQRNRKEFTRVPGYQERPRHLNEAKQIERIAWSIAINRKGREQRRGKAKRERTWLNPTFYGFLGRLIGDFQERQGDLLRQMIRDGLSPLSEPQKL